MPTHFPYNATHLLTFHKIVICKAPDWSNLWFFSSISFKCHLWNKFCISNERGVSFWFFFLNWTIRGVNSGVTQFRTQFTHVSRYFWALQRKKKTVYILGKMAVLENEISLEYAIFHKSETTISKQFFSNFFLFCFLF